MKIKLNRARGSLPHIYLFLRVFVVVRKTCHKKMKNRKKSFIFRVDVLSGAAWGEFFVNRGGFFVRNSWGRGVFFWATLYTYTSTAVRRKRALKNSRPEEYA